MRIVDVHIHLNSRPGTPERAQRIGHEATYGYFKEYYLKKGIELAIAMGGGPGPDDGMCHPMGAGFTDESPELPPHIGFCAGLQSRDLTRENLDAALCEFEQTLKDPKCVGIKMYPGYNFVYPGDPIHDGFYELAATYDVPVVFHTGDTANPRGMVKYSHPLCIDEVAVLHPNTRFVMAHYGNPWIVDATEVAKKNPNVFIDLSGLAQGMFDVDWFYKTYSGYIEHLRTWIAYLSDDSKLMYGCDFPLVNMDAYLEIIARLIDEKAHDAVFYQNALNVFTRLKNFTPLR